MPEVKRRGRPAKTETVAREQGEMAKATAVEPGVRQSDREPWSVIDHDPAGPACPRCGKGTERNTQIFKALGLAAVRCMKCKHAAIEGDNGQFFYDLKSAASGLLLRRAMIVYEAKHPTYPVPPVKSDVLSEIIGSDAGDPRWNE